MKVTKYLSAMMFTFVFINFPTNEALHNSVDQRCRTLVVEVMKSTAGITRYQAGQLLTNFNTEVNHGMLDRCGALSFHQTRVIHRAFVINRIPKKCLQKYRMAEENTKFCMLKTRDLINI